jgi:hypothetical protein
MFFRTAALAVCALAIVAWTKGNSTGITLEPAAPTHYFYTPTPYINEPMHIVIGLHELSMGLPYNLQVQASLFDNIGRVDFGAKYGFNRQFSVGAGLAYSIAHMGLGNHGIPRTSMPRIGLYAVYGPIVSDQFELGLTPNLQVGDRVSLGADMGMQIRPNPMWSIIWEVGSSYDFADYLLYLNTDAGIRVNPPQIKHFFFDAGIDLEEFAVNVVSPKPTVGLFLDVIFAFVAR